MTYVFDIDGTLADLSHRLHFIGAGPNTFVPETSAPEKDWDGFFAASAHDKPIFQVIMVARALAQAGHQIIYSTGRKESIRGITVEWLNKYRCPVGHLYMRKEDDHREDNVVKSELFDQILAASPMDSIAGVFEDREQVVKMYRDRGVKVFQVAPGKF